MRDQDTGRLILSEGGFIRDTALSLSPGGKSGHTLWAPLVRPSIPPTEASSGFIFSQMSYLGSTDLGVRVSICKSEINTNIQDHHGSRD